MIRWEMLVVSCYFFDGKKGFSLMFPKVPGLLGEWKGLANKLRCLWVASFLAVIMYSRILDKSCGATDSSMGVYCLKRWEVSC